MFLNKDGFASLYPVKTRMAASEALGIIFSRPQMPQVKIIKPCNIALILVRAPAFTLALLLTITLVNGSPPRGTADDNCQNPVQSVPGLRVTLFSESSLSTAWYPAMFPAMLPGLRGNGRHPNVLVADKRPVGKNRKKEKNSLAVAATGIFTRCWLSAKVDGKIGLGRT